MLHALRLPLLGLVLIVGARLALRAAAPPAPSIEHLVRQLSSDEFAEREAAEEALNRVGEPALPALRRATASIDVEVRTRAARVVRTIQGRLDRKDVRSEPPPRGAVVLFDGKGLDGWMRRDGSRAAWKLLPGGAMEVGGGDVLTRRTFAGRFRLHVEFWVPHLPRAIGQGRGNSGVFLQGRYEVQVLDSYGLPANKQSCASVYFLVAPLTNACKAPETWQSFDADFTAPKFRDGRKVEDARLTLLHNAVKAHDDVALTRPTPAALPGDASAPGPILLQAHGSPVRFRNVWLLPLPERPARRAGGK